MSWLDVEYTYVFGCVWVCVCMCDCMVAWDFTPQGSLLGLPFRVFAKISNHNKLHMMYARCFERARLSDNLQILLHFCILFCRCYILVTTDNIIVGTILYWHFVCCVCVCVFVCVCIEWGVNRNHRWRWFWSRSNWACAGEQFVTNSYLLSYVL